MLCNHMHSHLQYERTCGVTNFTCAEHDSDAPVHVTVGCAGNVAQSEWAANLPESPSVANAMHHVQPKWSVYRCVQAREDAGTSCVC